MATTKKVCECGVCSEKVVKANRCKECQPTTESHAKLVRGVCNHHYRELRRTEAAKTAKKVATKSGAVKKGATKSRRAA